MRKRKTITDDLRKMKRQIYQLKKITARHGRLLRKSEGKPCIGFVATDDEPQEGGNEQGN